MTRLVRALCLMLALLLTAPAGAVLPDEVLDDPRLETRARDISAQLRCLVCQNQSIDDSNAELARDLRVLVRDRLQAGDSNAEVFDYVVDRYGEFVLLKPVIAPHTIALWAAAPVVLVIGGGFLILSLRRRKRDEPGNDLSPDEQRALDELSGKS